ncbi:MAG TPA: response regulator, partial [Polyangiaceae bacterium]
MTQEPSIPPSEARHREEGSGLSSSRSEFAGSLNRRLESVLGALSALLQQPASGGRRDNFLRRVHALGASAKVLGFAAAGEALTHAEHQIRTSQPDTLADDILTVQKQLHELPTLVLRGPYSMAPPSRAGLASKPPGAVIAEPLAIVVWGSENLLELVRSFDKSGTTLELSVVTSPDRLRDACVSVGPDVLLLDAQQGSITLLVDELAQAPELGDAAIIVVNVPDEASQSLLELGVRVVLPTSFSAQQLSRALLQARHAPAERVPSPTPFGDITLKDLAERLAQEIRQGIVDCTVPSAHLERIALGDGTIIRAALWSSLARIRDHLVEATDGRIKFSAGPEGAELLTLQRYARSSRDQSVEAVDLTGRRILVVDDDPAVAWFVGGTLRAAGAEVTELHDGAEALALAYRTWPELVVSDVMMPGLDGFALCHTVKRDVLLRDVPIVLLSWKEDLLFRMRDLGADADAYLRKEASGSTIVRRVKELLVPRAALERRLSRREETRGRLDGTTMRLLLELVANVGRPLRIAVRDAEALYDIRVRNGSLVATTRTLHSGSTESATGIESGIIGTMLGITAGRFSVAPDREPCEPTLVGSLSEILQPSAVRARAAQRILSGTTLGTIEHLTIDAHAFGSDLPLLPVSLRPIADELLRGTAPRQLLASGVASVQLLESLLSDVARRGAVKRIVDVQGIDLLEREIQLLNAAPSLPPMPPPKPAQLPQFSFQLTPSPAPTSPTPTAAPITTVLPKREPLTVLPNQPIQQDGTERPGSPNPSQRRAFAGESSIIPTSKPPLHDDVDWALELTWDSTPPPPQPQRSADHSDAPFSRPVTSGGFMRPTIATLERGSLPETPDLANAVVKAMSEVTPPPVPPIERVDTSIETPASVNAERDAFASLQPAVSVEPEQLLRSTTIAGRNEAMCADSTSGIAAESRAADRGDIQKDLQGATASTTLQPFALAPSQPKLTPAAALPVVYQPPRPSEPKSEAPEIKGLFYRDPEDPVFPLISAPNSAVDIQPSIDVASGNHLAAHVMELPPETV